MKNKINNYDVLIVGGGLIGSLLALNLSRINKKILVIEKNKVTFQDSRTLAVNSNSKKFLEKINIWKKIKNEPQKLDKIIIRDYINKENLVFENQKRKIPKLKKYLLKIWENLENLKKLRENP